MYYYVKTKKHHSYTNRPCRRGETKAKLFTYYKGLYESLGLYEKFKPQIYKYPGGHGRASMTGGGVTIGATPPRLYCARGFLQPETGDFEWTIKMTETRQSCRAFDPVRTPDRAVLTQVLEAARLALSAAATASHTIFMWP